LVMCGGVWWKLMYIPAVRGTGQEALLDGSGVA